MKHLISHWNKNWMLIPLIPLAIVLIIWPQPFVNAIHWVFGIFFLTYAAVNFIRAVFYHREDVSLGDCLVRAILGIIILFLQKNAVTIIGIIWAFLSLEEAGQEVDDFVRLKKINVLNLILVIVSIVLSILLILDPEEHLGLHVRFVGIEIISTIILSRNNPE